MSLKSDSVKMDSEIRHLENKFADYEMGKTTDPYNCSTNEIEKGWENSLRTNIDSLLKRLEKKLQKGIDWKDFSVYTGTAGIALLYFHLALMDKSREAEFLNKALMYVEPSLPTLKGRRVSFLCGDPGPLALAAVIYQKLRMIDKSRELVKKLQRMSKHVGIGEDVPDELLYGRSGYVYALLFVRRHIGEGAIESTTIKSVVDTIVRSGVQLAKSEKSKNVPLMYKWHDKHYLGAAHGISGILYILMVSDSLSKEDLDKYVKPTLDFLISLRYHTGNYPSSIGSKTDLLVHWCHGAPGFVHMFALAYSVFGDDIYLREALGCGDAIWSRGLLKKGYGICHGVAGNAYAFLSLYKVTQDAKHLYRASKFAEFCFDYGTHGCRTADSPLSLFEGLAGTIYFLVSMLNPFDAAFPAFMLGL